MSAPLPTTKSGHGPRWRLGIVASRVGGRAGRLCVNSLVLLMLAWMIRGGGAAEAPVVTELEVKAAILPKLVMFIHWPAAAFSDRAEALRVGVIGPDPFGPHLAAALAGKKWEDRPLRLEACRSMGEAARCHLLFISGKTLEDVRGTVRELGRAPVVTVCDVPGFSAAGGMITLSAENKRMVLTINPSALREAGLRADPQLLRISRIEDSGAASHP